MHVEELQETRLDRTAWMLRATSRVPPRFRRARSVWGPKAYRSTTGLSPHRKQITQWQARYSLYPPPACLLILLEWQSTTYSGKENTTYSGKEILLYRIGKHYLQPLSDKHYL